MTRIGVVTPTLNAERYLEETLRSIWSQASDEIVIDHVIVDGGSSDGTLAIASGYPSRTIVSTDDQGMYDAVNRGMALVEGDVIGYINADDEIGSGGFGLISEAFGHHPGSGWLCGRVEYIDGEGGVLGRMQPVRLSLPSYLALGWSCIPQQTVWARRSFWERVGPFDIAYRNCGDYDWYARALQIQEPLILQQVLGRFRLHPGMLSLDAEKMARESRMVQERYGHDDDLAGFVRGKILSLRLNARNPAWLVAKKRGRISFTAR
ncbi:MAG: glycosyltransferase [Actinobacteria bacterium]|nr:glycosyltransferase [Actinomycetota bacterium]